MGFFDTQEDRTDLPLVVIPALFDGMRASMGKASLVMKDVARVRTYDDDTNDHSLVAQRLLGAEVGIIIGTHFDEDLLKAVARTVKCLIFGGTGVASYIDVDAARSYGVQVRNLVHYGDDSVAEHAIALMFELARKIGRMDHAMKSGEWDTLQALDLHGRSLGIVGFGGIGRSVASMAKALGMKVSVWARPTHHESVEEQGFTYVSDLTELFASSDIVSLHLGYNAATQGFITRKHLSAMKSGAFFINTARAELVEKGALENELALGRISAGVDVFYEEPLPADSPLRRMENIVMTPHSAWLSDAALTGLAVQTFEDALSYFNGTSLRLVN